MYVPSHETCTDGFIFTADNQGTSNFQVRKLDRMLVRAVPSVNLDRQNNGISTSKFVLKEEILSTSNKSNVNVLKLKNKRNKLDESRRKTILMEYLCIKGSNR